MKSLFHNINYIKLVFYLLLIYFIYLLALITFQYIPIKYDVAFLRLKQEEIKHLYYKIAFFSHVYSSIIIITLGLFQFSKTFRNRFCEWHKKIGKLYIALILFVASPSGLIMAFFANGGTIAQISFSILAILWFTYTFLAFNFIRKGNRIKHKHFMMRSYALTISAISLRLFKWGIVSFYELAPMDTYKIVAVAGWVINLLIVEIYIVASMKNNTIRPAQ